MTRQQARGSRRPRSGGAVSIAVLAAALSATPVLARADAPSSFADSPGFGQVTAGLASDVTRPTTPIEVTHPPRSDGHGDDAGSARVHPEPGTSRGTDHAAPGGTPGGGASLGHGALRVDPVDGRADRPARELLLGLLSGLLIAVPGMLWIRTRSRESALTALVEARTRALREREADLQRAEEIAQVGSWDFDIVADRSTTSAVGARITGVHPGEPLTLDEFLDRVYPPDRARVLRAWRKALEGKAYDIEHRSEIGGRLRWLRQRAVLERDGTGRAIRALGTVEDITERRAAEDALRDSEARLRNIIETTSEAVWVVDLDGRTTFTNPRLGQLLGCPSEQIIGRYYWEFMDADARELVARKLAQRKLGLSDQYELRLRRCDGTPIWTLLSSNPLRDAAGRIVGVLGMLIDNTERRNRQEDYERERRLLNQAERMASIGSWEWDIPRGHWSFSDGWLSLYGLDGHRDVVFDRILDRLVHPEDRDRVRAAMDTARSDGRPYDIEHRIIRADDGRIRHLQMRGEVMRDAEGALRSMFGVARDITGLREAEAEQRIAAIAFQAQEGMMVTDAEQRILRVNRAFTVISGYSEAEVIGRTPGLLSSGRHEPAFFTRMWDAIRTRDAWEGEIWNRRKSGEANPVWMTISAVRDANRRITHYVGTLTDLSARKAAEDEIRQLAFFDPLTGLPNRRLLRDRLGQALAASARSRRMGALFFLDLDDFKSLNDTRGHQVGDLLLEEVARRLTATVRESDSVARLGGDEFVLLLQGLGSRPEPAAAIARAIAEKVLTALRAPYVLAGKEHHSGCSIGVALFGHQPLAAEDVLKQADMAMYQAKAAGGNAVRFFASEMQDRLERQIGLETELRKAVLEGQLVLHYQAQVDADGRLAGAEALLRWQHPERGLVPPGDFIGLADRLGLALPLGRWVLRTACAQLAQWATRDGLRELNLSVNIGGAQFRAPGFVDEVRAALAESGADPRRLFLEITETPLLDDPADASLKMSALKEVGVGFTLDNFGVGYCSLAYLKRLPLDRLKIAPVFVRDVLADPEDDRIADRFVALAESLGLGLMAEGIETEAQRDYLIQHGCGSFQGFLFGRPGPVEDLTHRLSAATPDEPA